MAKIISVGKDLSKYNVVISRNALTHKNVMVGLKDKNKILVVTDSGIPKSFITDLKKILKNKKKIYVYEINKGEKSKIVNPNDKINVSETKDKDVYEKSFIVSSAFLLIISKTLPGVPITI